MRRVAVPALCIALSLFASPVPATAAELPEGVREDWWTTVRNGIESEEYHATRSGQAVDVDAGASTRVLHHAQLAVRDAAGRTLPAHFEGTSGDAWSGIRIVVDDRDAAYPVTIDPLASSPSWAIDGSQAGAQIALSVGPAGDVDGDGYDDVIIGAPYYDYGGADAAGLMPVFRGHAYFYLVRAENPCGSNLGTRSDGTPRVGRNCP